MIRDTVVAAVHGGVVVENGSICRLRVVPLAQELNASRPRINRVRVNIRDASRYLNSDVAFAPVKVLPAQCNVVHVPAVSKRSNARDGLLCPAGSNGNVIVVSIRGAAECSPINESHTNDINSPIVRVFQRSAERRGHKIKRIGSHQKLHLNNIVPRSIRIGNLSRQHCHVYIAFDTESTSRILKRQQVHISSLIDNARHISRRPANGH